MMLAVSWSFCVYGGLFIHKHHGLVAPLEPNCHYHFINTSPKDARIPVQCHRGNIHFVRLIDCAPY